MKYSRFLAYTLICLITISCSVKRPVTNSVLASDGKLWAALWQQRAAEYKALCFQAYNIARLRLDQDLQTDMPARRAIITDIDETILDNSPNAVHQALQGREFEPDSWYKWTAKADCDTLAGALSFFRYAASKGVTVFYITNRDEQEREATLKNLRRFGFPDADNEHLLLKQTVSDKEDRRLEVLKSHRIVLLLGDNLSDFSKLFNKLPEDERMKITRQQSGNFGSKFIVLPNSTYGDWENAIFQYNYKLNPAQKEEIIKKSLRDE